MLRENVVISGSLTTGGSTGQLIVPAGARSDRPSTPDTGSLYLETSSSGSVIMVYNGINNIDAGWEPIGSQDDSRIAFKYRTIITTSYTAGGYKDASPWKTVQRTINSTDQTVSVGDIMDYPSSYSSGGCSQTILFMWSVNTDNAWHSATDVNSTYTTGINMVNETGYAHQTKWDLTNARDQPGTLFQETLFAWIFGGAVAAVEKFNFTNETMYGNLYNAYTSTNVQYSSITSSLGAAGFSDENYGYGYGSESGMKLFFATDTMNVKQQWGASGQQKGISSKVGKGYAGNEGTYNGGYNLRRWDYATETNIGNVAKPYPNCGEENFTMGQDHQYMIGNYDGLQNNGSWKFYYGTDTGSSSVSGLNPTTHGGMSSGHCGWRA